MIINQETIDALSKQLRFDFNRGMDAAKLDIAMLAAILYTEYPSGSKANEYPFVQDGAGWQQRLGAIIYANLIAGTFLVPNLQYYRALEVPDEAIEDDTYNVYTPKMTEYGAGYMAYLRTMLINILLTNPTCCTGKAFLATDHAYGDHTFANLTTDALTKTSFEAALTASAAWMWADGTLIATNWTHLVVGPALRTTAFNIVKAETIQGEAAAIPNPNRGVMDMLVLQDLPGTRWFLIGSSLIGENAAKLGMRPLGLQIRRAPRVTNNDLHSVQQTGMLQMLATARGAAFPQLPHLIYGKVTA